MQQDLTTHTQYGKYVVHDTLTHRRSLRNYYISNDHRVQCLFPIQVAPGHVNGALTMGTESVKSENPDLKRWLVCLIFITD